MPTTMTIKGQVTIPKAVRDRAGLRPGSRVEISNATDGSVNIVPVVLDGDSELARRRAEIAARLDAAAAIWDAQRDPNAPWQDLTTDEYMAELREPLEPFERDGSLLR